MELARAKLRRRDGLPHLYGYPWYKWARSFFESRNNVNLLCAANQISKSSTQIRKCIDWATDTSKWAELWDTTPRQFWYLYPTADVASIEFLKKWEPEFMPRHEFQNDDQYGYKVERQRGQIKALHFNTGVTVYFKAYSQDVHHLQSGTCHAIFCDEELPVNLWDELNLRLAAVGGHFHMVFTATLNQDYWRRAIEPDQRDMEVLRDAWKKQVSMYECLEYENGGKTPWNLEKIKQIENKCRSEAEKDRRVNGRFVTEEGRVYQAFDASKHYMKTVEVPKNWAVFSAVDIGSGGDTGHPSAMVFVAVRPDYQLGYVFRGCRMDGEDTTNGDVLDRYIQIRGDVSCTSQVYDWASKDFFTIATRNGEGFTKAEKNHEIGEGILNTLFRNDMLKIFDTDEMRKLGSELSSIMTSTAKRGRKDDFADALRYACASIPWDFTAIELSRPGRKKKVFKPPTEEERMAQEINERRGLFEDSGPKNEEWKEMEAEFDYWNEQYG